VAAGVTPSGVRSPPGRAEDTHGVNRQWPIFNLQSIFNDPIINRQFMIVYSPCP
jgi:hypothetical protein